MPSERHSRPAERHAVFTERHCRPAERHSRPAERHAVFTERHSRPAERHSRPAERHSRHAERRAVPAEGYPQPAARAPPPPTRDLTAAAPLASVVALLMTRPPTPHPGAARLANPAVRRRMREVIGRQVQEEDAKDVVQSALVSLLLMAPHLPASDDGLLGLVVVVTRHKLVDHARRVTVRDGRDAAVEDLDALPERNAPPSPETRATWAAMLALVEREIAAGNVPPEVLGWAIGLAEGKTIAEMAREGDVSESRIKMALKRSREVLNLRWKEISGAAGLGLLLVLAALWLPKRGAPPDIQAEPAPRAPPSATASASPGPSAPAVQAPQALRDRARTRCAARDWAGCEDALDEAAAQDPDSERRPDVIAMREAIARGVKADRQGDKPPTP